MLEDKDDTISFLAKTLVQDLYLIVPDREITRITGP